jgi:hypothetical protein
MAYKSRFFTERPHVTARPHTKAGRAEEVLRQTQEMLTKLVDDNPKNASYRANLASNYRLLGATLQQAGQVKQAEEILQKGD